LTAPIAVPPPRDSFADALAEAKEVADASFEERYRMFEAACALVFEILETHPDRQQILDYRDPLPADAPAVFERARRAEPEVSG
jgi:hypothetical protein